MMKWDPSETEAQIKGTAESGEVVPTSESVLEMRLLQALAFKFYFLTGFQVICLVFLPPLTDLGARGREGHLMDVWKCDLDDFD